MLPDKLVAIDVVLDATPGLSNSFLAWVMINIGLSLYLARAAGCTNQTKQVVSMNAGHLPTCIQAVYACGGAVTRLLKTLSTAAAASSPTLLLSGLHQLTTVGSMHGWWQWSPRNPSFAGISAVERNF